MKFLAYIVLAGLALAGCSTQTDVSVTGTVPASVTHLAVTVQEIWFATAADTAPDASSGWLKKTLATPVTVDLAALTPGTLVSIATALNVSAGTYRQVHLVLADSADSLTAAAQALGLLYNGQITLTDTSGNVTTAPLESLVPHGGLTIPTDLTLSGSLATGTSSGTNSTSTSTTSSTVSTAALLVALDAARDVLPYAYGTSTGYLLSPSVSVLDASLAGGISGTVDTSALASGHGPVFVSAETVSKDDTHHVVVARTRAAIDGSFTLYPLPAPKSGSTSYDLVIAGAGAETVIVRAVPVSAGVASSATLLESGTLALAAAPIVYTDLSAASPLLPGGTRVTFYETVTATNELPYALDGTAIDPVGRRLPGDAFALSAGPLMVGNYAGGGSITFSTVTPAEGIGAFLIGTDGFYRADTLASVQTRVSGTQAAPTQAFAPVPLLQSGAIAGVLTIAVTAPAGRYDSGFLVASSGNRLVETARIGSVLASGTGTVSLTLPGGSALASATGVPYQVAIRAWNSADPANTFVRAAGSASATLGNSGAAALSVTVP